MVRVVSAADFALPALLGEAAAASGQGIAVGEENWGRILAANSAFCELVGYTSEELLALTGRDLSASEPAAMAAAYRTATRPGGLVRTRASLRRKDGALVAIDDWMTQTKVAGIDFLLVITDPISTAVAAV
jgi:PAS domain S-box-containing protein